MKKIGKEIIRRFSSAAAANTIKPPAVVPDTSLLLEGKIMSTLNLNRTKEILRNIQKAEFRVFSQWGDDGIIQFLVHYLDIENRTFIEFGVEDYCESNTRFLLMNDNWKGLIMDASDVNINKIKSSNYYWKHDLNAHPLFVDVSNINDFIGRQGFGGEIGLLHIDIDGNDYWIWKCMEVVKAVIVIVEYNAVFGQLNPWTIPYTKDFYRTAAHHSNLYWGSSLLSLCDLADEKGYDFIGTNSAGNNAYFIKQGCGKELRRLRPKDGFTESRYRESRDTNGGLTYLSGDKRLDEIRGCKVYNTRTNEMEII